MSVVFPKIRTVHDSQHHVPFREDSFRQVHVGRMGASVDNPIHIEIQVIKLGQQGIVGDNFIDFGIAFTNPTVKLGYGYRSRGWEVSDIPNGRQQCATDFVS